MYLFFFFKCLAFKKVNVCPFKLRYNLRYKTGEKKVTNDSANLVIVIFCWIIRISSFKRFV